MKNLGCMMTGYTIPVDGPVRDDDVIVVVQRGKVIGVFSAEGQEGLQTLRMTFTRETPEAPFVPLQGQGIQHFPPPTPSKQLDEYPD